MATLVAKVHEPEQSPAEAWIRTSDRASFKRCRRRWGWGSHLKGNLEPQTMSEPFWLGNAIHYVLEDYHGWNVYKSPVVAMKAFYTGYKRSKLDMPDNVKELLDLGVGMMEHYLEWLRSRDSLRTYWLNGHPQCEVRFKIPLPITNPRILEQYPGGVFYTGKLDRVSIDDNGHLWIVEYKTAKRFEENHFQTDGQVSAYSWACQSIYELPCVGTIYQQHRKDLPEEPRYLSSGKVSAAVDQLTTWAKYHSALVNLYGKAERAPEQNIYCLNSLAEMENEDRDRFIRRDRISRNPHQAQTEGAKILLEVEDMLNPDLALYPNPTRDCSWCSFVSPCVSMDDGSDWFSELEATCQQRKEEPLEWRKFLPQPSPQEV